MNSVASCGFMFYQKSLFFRNIPRVANCCFFFDMNAGGTLLSVFGVITGLAYLARALHVLYNVPHFEMKLEEDDALNNEDDAIW